MLDLEGKGKFLKHLYKYLCHWISFLVLFCLQCVTARSENPLINKCHQALMSHIFFSHLEWGSTPDGKCCVCAGNCKAWPDSGDTLLHQSLNKEQMLRDFLSNSVTLTVLAQDFFQTFLVFLLWLVFHILAFPIKNYCDPPAICSTEADLSKCASVLSEISLGET